MNRTEVKINYAMAWKDLKEIIERGDITFEGDIAVSDLQKAMSQLEQDARE